MREARRHDNEDFRNLFTDIPSGGRHFLAFRGPALVSHAAEIGDDEIACLQTDIPESYEPLGWEVWRGALAGSGERGPIPTPEQRGVMVLRLPRAPPLDLQTQLSIECQPGRIWE